VQAPRSHREWGTAARIGVAFCALLATLLVVEAASALRLRVTTRSWHYLGDNIRKFEEQVRGAAAHAPRLDESVEPPVVSLHPYLGFVYNPDRSTFFYGWKPSRFGFYSRVDATYRRQGPDEFVVGLFGGSVAAHLNVRAEREFTEELARCSPVAGRRVVVNAICQGGYRQPQQVLALNYFLGLGAEFDVVVNLDGVNEVTSFHDNEVKHRIDPSYPYSWQWLARGNINDPVLLKELDLALKAREALARSARVVEWSDFYRSAAVRLLWERLHRKLADREAQANQRITSRMDLLAKESKPPYSVSGTTHPGPRPLRKTLAAGAALWARYSLQMHQLLAARGIPYVHALQPNQYFPGTKPLTSREATSFTSFASPYAAPLREGYPLLLEEGAALRRQGVHFVDLSQAFGDVESEIYEDDCCHFNDDGNRRLARLLARSVCDQLTAVAGAR